MPMVMEPHVIRMLDLSAITAFLNRENIRCSNKDKIRDKLAQIKRSGHENIQVLADFDYTISHCWYEGERMSSSFGALERYSGMSEDFRTRTRALYDHYYPIEVDPTVEAEEKVQLMTEWFTRSAGYIIEEGVTPDLVREAADTSKVKIRERFAEFAELLRSKGVPLMVFSAGIGQIIQRVFETAGIPMDDQVKLVANMLEFNGTTQNGTTRASDGATRASQFKPPLITTGNKSIVAKGETEYFNSHQNRVNSILLGDNIEDVQMAACVREYSDNVLTVGFLNDRVEDRLDLYTTKFDLVILNDPDFSDLIALLECVQ